LTNFCSRFFFQGKDKGWQTGHPGSTGEIGNFDKVRTLRELFKKARGGCFRNIKESGGGKTEEYLNRSAPSTARGQQENRASTAWRLFIQHFIVTFAPFYSKSFP
jgi:hypothetical protein